ncbi:MAG: hypothetical protein AAGK00_03085 [Pseudomonadota bacterium]
MSFFSGLATASGVSSQLNAPRDFTSQIRSATGERGVTATTEQTQSTPVTPAATARPVGAANATEAPAPSAEFLDSGDSRYQQFVRALEVLRIDTGDPERDDARLAEMAAEAPDIFALFDGRPGPVEVPDSPPSNDLSAPDAQSVAS